MTEQAKEKLRLVVYHTMMMWNASTEAEELLGQDICCSSADHLAVGLNSPEDALTLDEEELAEAFEL